jgi:hypothetical protein
MANVYPDWWCDTVTLYNRYEDNVGEITWYRTVLTGCFWKYITDYNRVGDVTDITKVLLCRVRKSNKYLDCYKWQALSDKSGKFTFNEGDILIKGKIEDTVDEYTDGIRSSDLLLKYKDRCAQITESRDNTGTGKVDEHYLVRGI